MRIAALRLDALVRGRAMASADRVAFEAEYELDWTNLHAASWQAAGGWTQLRVSADADGIGLVLLVGAPESAFPEAMIRQLADRYSGTVLGADEIVDLLVAQDAIAGQGSSVLSLRRRRTAVARQGPAGAASVVSASFLIETVRALASNPGTALVVEVGRASAVRAMATARAAARGRARDAERGLPVAPEAPTVSTMATAQILVAGPAATRVAAAAAAELSAAGLLGVEITRSDGASRFELPLTASSTTGFIEEAEFIAKLCRPPLVPQMGASDLPSREVLSGVGAVDSRPDGPSIVLGRTSSGRPVCLTLEQINEHVLVAGLPNTGKSTLVANALLQLWNQHGVPSLVIDPQGGVDPSGSPGTYQQLFRNLEARDGRQPRILRIGRGAPPVNLFVPPDRSWTGDFATAVVEALDEEWQLRANFVYAHVVLQAAVFRLMAQGEPSLDSLVREVRAELGRRPRSGLDNVEAAKESLFGRLLELSLSSAGEALAAGPDGAINWDELVKGPVLIELSFGDLATTRLVGALLLAAYTAYWKTSTLAALRHVTVLEEAHTFLAEGPPGATPKLTELVTNGLAEDRKHGVGFILVDQAPGRLGGVASDLASSSVVLRSAVPDASMLAAKLGSADLAAALPVLPNRQALVRAAGFDLAVPTILAPPVGVRSNRDLLPLAHSSEGVAPRCLFCPSPCDAPEGVAESTGLLVQAAAVFDATPHERADAIDDLLRASRSRTRDLAGGEQRRHRTLGFCAGSASLVVVAPPGIRTSEVLMAVEALGQAIAR